MKLGRIAYEAYCKSSDGKSLISGQALPTWGYLSPPIQAAWDAAGSAAADAEKPVGTVATASGPFRLSDLPADVLARLKAEWEAATPALDADDKPVSVDAPKRSAKR